METYTDNFGARLRSLIEGKGITLGAFAAEYGIAESQLFNWLKKDTPPLPKHWPKLAKYFGVSVQFLISGTPEKQEARTPVVEESQASYGRHADKGGNRAPPVTLNPKYKLPPREPTREQCLEYLSEYMDKAEDLPGGIGHVWFQLHIHFPVANLDKVGEPK